MNEMILSTDIQRLVDVRNAIVSQIEAAMSAFQEAERLSREVGLGDFLHWMNDRVWHAMKYDHDAGHLICREIDRIGWRRLMDESGMISLMDARAREEWNRQVYDGDVPELSLENILATFKDLHGRKDELFERGVIEAFKALSWDYKTHSPVCFGKKIIMNHAVNYWEDYGFRVEHTVIHRLDDLERIFHLLDGRPAPEARHVISMKLSHFMMDHRGFNRYLEHPYFDLKWFKKGSLHVVFKREDLVGKMNRILAKHFPDALPAAR